MVNKIGIIIPYFGKYPPYLNHFMAGCGYNPSIDWLLMTDIENIPKVSKNIHIIKSDLDAFNKLAGYKLGFPVEVQNPYKLCDFKPAYGLIFEDWLEKYDYWGYCDMDLILGKIEQFQPTDKILNYDIISTYKGFLSGPFCLYRNTEKLKRLFTVHPDYKSIFQDPNYLGFDENIQRSSISGYSLRKIFYFFQFIFNLQFKSELFSFSFKELRYQFQWFVKRKTVSEQNLSDISEIAFLKHRIGEIKVFTEELLYSDSYYKRLNRKTWRIKWEKGILTDLDITRQIFGFHFRESKNQPGFKIDNYDGAFTTTEKGIFNER
jgi:hypothetical protein